jgi:hypothetical protein
MALVSRYCRYRRGMLADGVWSGEVKSGFGNEVFKLEGATQVRQLLKVTSHPPLYCVSCVEIAIGIIHRLDSYL